VKEGASGGSFVGRVWSSEIVGDCVLMDLLYGSALH